MSSLMSVLGLSSLALVGTFSMLIGFAFFIATGLLVAIPMILARRKKTIEPKDSVGKMNGRFNSAG